MLLRIDQDSVVLIAGCVMLGLLALLALRIILTRRVLDHVNATLARLLLARRTSRLTPVGLLLLIPTSFLICALIFWTSDYWTKFLEDAMPKNINPVSRRLFVGLILLVFAVPVGIGIGSFWACSLLLQTVGIRTIRSRYEEAGSEMQKADNS